jgi:hypothetical protein
VVLLANTLADADLPDPGQSTVIATSAVVGTVFGGTLGILRYRSIEEAQSFAFVGGVLGGATGIVIYLSVLLAGVP